MTQPTYTIQVPGLHAGQQAIYDHPARYKVVRCGRRFGKTQMGVYIAVMAMLKGREVGWFAPQSDYYEEAWTRLERVLRPLIKSKDKNRGYMEIIGAQGVGGGILRMFTTHLDKDSGRSFAFDELIYDEAGLEPALESMWENVYSFCLIDRMGRAWVLGTSKVAGIGFRKLFQRGERREMDGAWMSFRAKSFDNPFLPEEAKREQEYKRNKMTPIAWSAEYEGGDDDGGAMFFPSALIERLALECTDPLFRCNIDLPLAFALDRDHWIGDLRRDVGKVKVLSDEAGAWEFWIDLVPDRFGRMRPPQNKPYVFGIDVGNGVGANPTIISAGDAETGRKIAVYRTTRVTPPEAARHAAIAGHWFGGVLGSAQINYEANGPGESFGQSLVQVGYPGIIRRSEFGSRLSEETKEAYGWWSTERAKETLLIAYREALTGGTFWNPSARGLRECLPYRYDGLRIVTDIADDGTHGDETIADALLRAAMDAVPKGHVIEIPPPVGSEAFLEKVAEAKRGRGSGW